MTETGTYDYRLRATKIAATATSPTALTLGYTWNANGNLQEETIGPNSSCTIPQYFYYDHVNRVQMSVESPTTVPAQTATACPTPTSSFTWCEQFAYDQFGNRTPTTFNLGATPLAPTAFNAATNRISSTGWAYDAGAGSGNGNITTDPSNAKMTLDGENRMVSYTPGSGAAVQYTYDGDGRRVTKDATSGAPTTYVYDAAGQLTAAYSSVANPVTGTEFLTADHLGSIRMITNSTGNAVARHDTEPFGEELLGGSTGCRLSSLGYGATSGVTLEFTGKERDAETGLDFFGERYNSSAQGRFTSPDPYEIVVRKNQGKTPQERQALLNSFISNPQAWNKYAYGLNNPLRNIDIGGNCSAPSGLRGGQTGICVEAFIANKSIGGIGKGDNRSFSSSGGSYRFRVDIRVDPGANGKVSINSDAAKSSVLIEGLGFRGKGTASLSPVSTDGDGNRTFTVSGSAVNGEQSINKYVPFFDPAPKGDINFDLTFTVSPQGDVTLDKAVSRTFPSLEIYSYGPGGQGPTELLNFSEKNPGDLQKPKQCVGPVINCAQ